MKLILLNILFITLAFFAYSQDSTLAKNVGFSQKEQINNTRTHSFLFNYSNKAKEDKSDHNHTFSQITYELYKPYKLFKFSVTRVLEKFDSMRGGKSLDYIFIPRLYDAYTYLRYNIGICYIYNSGGEGLDHVLLPTFGIEAGFVNKIYGHFKYIDENIYSFWNFGITYKFDRPFTKLTIGKSFHNESKWTYYFNGRVSICDLLQFQIMGKYSFKNEFGYFLFGIGFFLND